MNITYKEWLLDILIRCGVGMIRDTEFDWSFLNKAVQQGHIVYGDDENFNFVAYMLTPSAAEYLERYDG